MPGFSHLTSDRLGRFTSRGLNPSCKTPHEPAHSRDDTLWIAREPAAVYWAAPTQLRMPLFWTRRTEYALTLHTPASLPLGAMLAQDELITILQWLRWRNPDALIGSYSPKDSNGRLSGNDPWSPQTTSGDSGDPIGPLSSSSARDSDFESITLPNPALNLTRP